jgi:putative phosphoribosyl transferase
MFRNREEAGRALAAKLADYRSRDGSIVLGLPRGGVAVAAALADELRLPLDVYVVRKLGVPGHEELAMGAIASGGTRVVNESVIRELGIAESDVAATLAVESRELERREREYRGEAEPLDLAGRTVLLVDDGVATGASMYAALLAVRAQEPARVVVAVPVAARGARETLEQAADEVVALEQLRGAVGSAYQDFSQTDDAEVRRLLAAAGR